MVMIDECVPYEDYEYNIVGNYRSFFAFVEFISLSSLTTVTFFMPISPTKLFLQFSVLAMWPIIPFRIIKIFYTMMFPFEASQSYLVCILIRIETTLQYSFSLTHLLFLCYFVISILKNKTTGYQVTPKMRRSYISICAFSSIISILFVNMIHITRWFAIIYAAIFVLAAWFHIINSITVLCCSACRKNKYRPQEEIEGEYKYSWLFFMLFPSETAHFYHSAVVDTFLIPVFFPQFSGSYYNTFRYVTGVVSVRFLVSIIFATGPMFLLPPVRSTLLRSLKKFRKDAVADETFIPIEPEKVNRIRTVA